MSPRRLLACAVASLAAFSCGPGESSSVARLSVAPAAVSLPHPGIARLEARWELLAGLPAGGGSPHVFVHLLAKPGDVVRTFDHPLAFAWEVGERRTSSIELWQSALDPALPPGAYDLTVGLYDPQGGTRYPLATGGEAVDRHEYRLARVEVPGERSPIRVSFAGGWSPPDPSADRQVLNRRWLADEGAIVLEGIPAALELTLAFQVPQPGGGEQRLVLDEGQSAAAVRVAADCSEERAQVTGFGPHRVRLRVPRGERCAVSLDPNFSYFDLGSLARRSLHLEVLAWSPAEP